MTKITERVSPDLRGPIAVPGIQPSVTADGVEAIGYRPVRHEAKQAGGTARWIHAQADAPVALFRREFELQGRADHAVARVSADISYRLWVNGRLAGRGPADIGMDYHRVQTGHWFYDVWDIAPLLQDGVNVVAAEVFAEPLIGWEGTRGKSAFRCDVEFPGTDITPNRPATDASWKSLPSRHWRRQDAPRAHWQYVGAEEPVGWRNAGFDDSAWPNAEVAADIWQPLEQSDIPPRMETEYPIADIAVGDAQAALPVRLASGGVCTVRYDRVIPAFIGVRVRGGRGGTLLIQPNETRAPGFNRMASIDLPGAEQVVELPFLDSFTVIRLTAVGVEEPVEIVDVKAIFASQPVPYRGAFACSDARLTRLWSVCRWATQICLQTHHLDSPHHQEPISDPGDYLIESLVNYYAFMQPALTRQDLRKYAWILEQCENRCFHTSYALLWLQMLLDYYDYTGDEALVRELAPSVFSLIDTFLSYRGRNGLISEAPNYMFMDWVEIAGFAAHHPPAVIGQGYMTAFTYRALADAIRVARMNGEAARAETYERLRAGIAAAFERELWCEEKGQYRDGRPFQTSVRPNKWLPADTEIETFSAQVNVLAVLYDLCPQERRAAVLEKAMSGPSFNCQPYFMHFVLNALAHVGLFEKQAVAQMHRWEVVEETRSLREMWNRGDLSHGWGATPLYQMSARILGVQPAAPGYREILVAPQQCGLEWAKGSVPLPEGDVTVEWRRESEGFQLTLAVPAGYTARVKMPGSDELQTIVGGRTVVLGSSAAVPG